MNRAVPLLPVWAFMACSSLNFTLVLLLLHLLLDVYNRSRSMLNCFFGLSSYDTDNIVLIIQTVSLAPVPTSQHCLSYEDHVERS